MGFRFGRLWTFDEDTVAAQGLITAGVAGTDFDEAPTVFRELNGLGEGPIRLGFDLLSVDLDPRAWLAAPAHDEDTTVGFDVCKVKLRRSRVFFSAAAPER